MRRRDNRSIASYVPFLLFIICLGVVAVGSGYLLGRFFMSSLSALREQGLRPRPTAQDVSQRPAAKMTINAPGMSVFRVQAGLYNVKENADRQAAALKKAGIPAEIVGTTPPYRVLVGLLATQDSAGRVAASVKAQRFDVIVGRHEIKPRSFAVSGDSGYPDLVKNAVQASYEALDKCLKAIDSYILGRKVDLQEVASVTSSFTSTRQKLMDSKAPAGAEKVHREVGLLLDAVGGALSSLQAAGSSSQPPASVLGDVCRAVIQYDTSISALSQ